MDRTVIITGCSSGIGRATAEAFQDDGWTTYATARDAGDVEDLADAGCETMALDVTVADEVAAVVEHAVEATGRLDCVVNNAGYGQHGPLEDVPPELLRRQLDVNVTGPHRLAREALPHMREQGDGTVVNVSSIAGRVATPGTGAYSGSKFALEGMSDALRVELAPHGVDVVLVEPGPVDTSFRERVESELGDLDRSEAYESVYGFQEGSSLFGADGPLSVPPERVADAVLAAANAPDPEPRYPVGRGADVLALARYLPDRIRDAVFRTLL
jgi:NAD(P)-dependent dehydrogenase (short-subunit alcohol dehydrogenase family)